MRYLLAIVLTLFVSVSFAQVEKGEPWNILNITLDETYDAAKQTLEKDYPGADIRLMHGNVKADKYVSPDIKFGFFADLNKNKKYHNDSIYGVLDSRDTEKIIALERMLVFKLDELPTIENLKQLVFSKYGKPSGSFEYGPELHYFWFRNVSSKLNNKEGLKLLRDFGVAVMESHKNILQQKIPTDISGTVLHVMIFPFMMDGKKHLAAHIKSSIIDYSEVSASSKALHKLLDDGIAKQREEQLKASSQMKPAL